MPLKTTHLRVTLLFLAWGVISGCLALLCRKNPHAPPKARQEETFFRAWTPYFTAGKPKELLKDTAAVYVVWEWLLPTVLFKPVKWGWNQGKNWFKSLRNNYSAQGYL